MNKTEDDNAATGTGTGTGPETGPGTGKVGHPASTINSSINQADPPVSAPATQTEKSITNTKTNPILTAASKIVLPGDGEPPPIMSSGSRSTNIDTFAAVASQAPQLSSSSSFKRKFAEMDSKGSFPLDSKGSFPLDDGLLGPGGLFENPADRRLSHNMNNRKRLRAISDRINRLRELIESNGQRIGPRKLDILDACVQFLQASKQQRVVNGVAGRAHPPDNTPLATIHSIYSRLFETSDLPQIIVMISPVSANILNISDSFMHLTGWTRQDLVSKPYSNISGDEPQSWSVQYQLLIHDANVKALQLSNIPLSAADGSKFVVNLRVKPLRLGEFSVATSLCFSIVSVGMVNKKPQLQIIQR